MTLSIRNPSVERRVREMAARTGKSITAVVDDALREYAARRPADDKTRRFRELDAILAEFDAMPAVDTRSAKEIMDDLYDDAGLPK
jgi:antitoxin VapB